MIASRNIFSSLGRERAKNRVKDHKRERERERTRGNGSSYLRDGRYDEYGVEDRIGKKTFEDVTLSMNLPRIEFIE